MVDEGRVFDFLIPILRPGIQHRYTGVWRETDLSMIEAANAEMEANYRKKVKEFRDTSMKKKQLKVMRKTSMAAMKLEFNARAADVQHQRACIKH